MAEGTKNEAARAIDAKTLIMAALFLAGGAGAGGGASVLGGNGVKEEVVELRKSVDAMRTDLAVISKTTSAAEAAVTKQLPDHEERIRALENLKRK